MNPYMKYLIEDCYLEDYNPYYAEFWYDNYCYEYSFKEWYFLYRKRDDPKVFKFTPAKLIIGQFLSPVPFKSLF